MNKFMALVMVTLMHDQMNLILKTCVAAEVLAVSSELSLAFIYIGKSCYVYYSLN